MLGILLDKKEKLPLKRQLYQALMERITGGLIASGETIPSTRELAKALNVSRSTVCEAYDMLLAEGYIVSRQGAPTTVFEKLRLEKMPEVSPHTRQADRLPTSDFRTGRPDLSLFPRYMWQQAMRKAADQLPLEEYGYTGPQGLYVLRAEIAAWLFRSRGLRVLPEDIFITAGATQALHLAADLLYESGRKVLTEDPCHRGMLRIFQLKGFPISPVPVDGCGLMTDCLPTDIDACAVYVTPSHQFPLGGILPASRRAALIRYAREKDLYIIEDDYDSEFRYTGEPVSPLYALDSQRVIYMGTFSKSLFPSLRIGFVLLPRLLQKQWLKLRKYTDVQNPPFEQAALALFLKERKLDGHIQKMRKVYAGRRKTLLDTAKAAFGAAFASWGDAAGLHTVLQFPGLRFDDDFRLACLSEGIDVMPVERHCIEKGRHQDKMLLGYGHLTQEEIRDGVFRLAEAMNRHIMHP